MPFLYVFAYEIVIFCDFFTKSMFKHIKKHQLLGAYKEFKLMAFILLFSTSTNQQ